MNQYMIDIDLPSTPTEEFIELIPSQRAHVNTLMAESKIVSYSLSMDRSRLWVIVNAETSEAAREVGLRVDGEASGRGLGAMIEAMP